jgi:hypothetical protein
MGLGEPWHPTPGVRSCFDSGHPTNLRNGAASDFSVEAPCSEGPNINLRWLAGN